MKKYILIIFVGIYFLLFSSASAQAEITCGWEKWNNSSRFCTYGFDSEAEINDHLFRIQCVGNCSSNWAADWWGQIFAGQTIPISQMGSLQDIDGKYYSCFAPEGDYDGSVYNVYESCLNPKWIEKVANNPVCLGALAVGAVGTTTIVGSGGLAGPAIVPFTLKVTSACAAALGVGNVIDLVRDLEAKCAPQFQTRVRLERGFWFDKTVCESPLTFSISTNIEDIADIVDFENEPFSICSQIPKNTEERELCEKCSGGDRGNQGIWTAVGCINRSPESILTVLLRIGLTIGGGIALLMILGAGFIMSTSAGDPNRVDQAKELVTSAVIGLIFIIFSVAILQFIGFTVLKIPGFGG